MSAAVSTRVTLTNGTRLGPYEILSALGAGGMGEVYRARDATLNRDVALKVLPELFALDLDRLARFRREAQVLASLNHPNIAAIYGFEESNNSPGSEQATMRALVLELVEGPTLADRLAQGPIPVDEALPIARQIADALEAAHEQGIVHRDLKPANIKLRPDGNVKVLDFGLAKVVEPVAVTGGDVTASPTITSPAMTQMGVILGTAAYMSPEQAKGRPADKRSDVWAFGAVLYEMLSGQRPFKGDDISDTLAAVLRQDIDWTALPASTPASVRRLLGRCLDRDGRRRLRDIGEARIVLDDPAALARGDAGVVSALTPRQPPWRRAMPVVLSVVMAGALVGTAWYLSLSPSTPQDVTRLTFNLPAGQAFPIKSSNRHLIALSADGTQMVYVASPPQLFLRYLSEDAPKAIQGTEDAVNVTEPVFSPDGREIAFYSVAAQTIKKIAVTGGTAVPVCPADNPYGLSWGPEGILFGQGSKGIMRVSPDSSTPDVLVRVKDGEEAHGPQLLPGGQHVLFTITTGSGLDQWEKARIVVQSVTSGGPKTLFEGGSDARYVKTGHIVYSLGGVVYAVAFDAQRLEVRGRGVPMVPGLRRAWYTADFSVSGTGSLIYIPGPDLASTALHEIALIDRKGAVELLHLPPGSYVSPRTSPDGTRIAFGAVDGNGATIYTYDLSGASTMEQLTSGGKNRFPIWSRDSQHVAFQSDRGGDLAIWQSTVGGEAQRLTKAEPGETHAPESWHPKEDTLLFTVTRGSDVSLRTLSLKDGKVMPFGGVHSSTPTGAVFSPDGLLVAYTIFERGRATTYVQSYPATGVTSPLVAKASDGPHWAVWSTDGKELFYDPRPGGFEVVSVRREPTVAFGNPVAVPRPFRSSPSGGERQYDMTPSGKLLGLIPAGQSESGAPLAPQIQVILNWFVELRARVPPMK